MTSATGVFATSRPLRTTLRIRSRSVKMPTRRVPSSTTAERGRRRGVDDGAEQREERRRIVESIGRGLQRSQREADQAETTQLTLEAPPSGERGGIRAKARELLAARREAAECRAEQVPA